MTWKAGESGNPNGSSGPKRFQNALERALAQDDSKRLRQAIESMLDEAAKGKEWAIQFLADRLDGKAAQTVTVTRNVTDLTDDVLLGIASGSSDRASKTQGGEEKSSQVH